MRQTPFQGSFIDVCINSIKNASFMRSLRQFCLFVSGFFDHEWTTMVATWLWLASVLADQVFAKAGFRV
jgi:hypothetical protein